MDIPDAAQKALKREQAAGLLIVGVEKDSPAAKGGLIVGDILVEWQASLSCTTMSCLPASTGMWRQVHADRYPARRAASNLECPDW